MEEVNRKGRKERKEQNKTDWISIYFSDWGYDGSFVMFDIPSA